VDAAGLDKTLRLLSPALSLFCGIELHTVGAQ